MAADRVFDCENVSGRRLANSQYAEQTDAEGKWQNLQPEKLEVYAVCVRSLVVLLGRRHAGEHVEHQRAVGGVGRDVEVLRRVLTLQVDVGRMRAVANR